MYFRLNLNAHIIKISSYLYRFDLVEKDRKDNGRDISFLKTMKRFFFSGRDS